MLARLVLGLALGLLMYRPRPNGPGSLPPTPPPGGDMPPDTIPPATLPPTPPPGHTGEWPPAPAPAPAPAPSTLDHCRIMLQRIEQLLRQHVLRESIATPPVVSVNGTRPYDPAIDGPRPAR